MLQYPDMLTTYQIQRANAKIIFKGISIYSISHSHELIYMNLFQWKIFEKIDWKIKKKNAYNMFYILKLRAKLSKCGLAILKIQKYIPLASSSSFWYFSSFCLYTVHMAQSFTKESGDWMPYSSSTLKSESSKFGTTPSSMAK